MRQEEQYRQNEWYEQDERYMREAIRQAKKAAAVGVVPFGSGI